MKLKKILLKSGEVSSELYEVEDISFENIKRPSKIFMGFIRMNDSYSFLNNFTLEQFTKEVKERFASE